MAPPNKAASALYGLKPRGILHNCNSCNSAPRSRFLRMQRVEPTPSAHLRALAAEWREQAGCCRSRRLAEQMLNRAKQLEDKAAQLERQPWTKVRSVPS